MTEVCSGQTAQAGDFVGDEVCSVEVEWMNFLEMVAVPKLGSPTNIWGLVSFSFDLACRGRRATCQQVRSLLVCLARDVLFIGRLRLRAWLGTGPSRRVRSRCTACMQRGQQHWLALDFVAIRVDVNLNFGNQPLLVPRLQSKLVQNDFVETCVVKKSFQKTLASIRCCT